MTSHAGCDRGCRDATKYAAVTMVPLVVMVMAGGRAIRGWGGPEGMQVY